MSIEDEAHAEGMRRYPHHDPCPMDPDRDPYVGCRCGAMARWTAFARGVAWGIAWQVAHDREVKARAWDEGRAARYRPELDNPYRADDQPA